MSEQSANQPGPTVASDFEAALRTVSSAIEATPGNLNQKAAQLQSVLQQLQQQADRMQAMADAVSERVKQQEAQARTVLADITDHLKDNLDVKPLERQLKHLKWFAVGQSVLLGLMAVGVLAALSQDKAPPPPPNESVQPAESATPPPVGPVAGGQPPAQPPSAASSVTFEAHP